MERINRDTYRLSTGRELHANCGIIGLVDSNGTNMESGWEVATGYDDTEPGVIPNEYWQLTYPKECWTAAERAELADYMIALWQRFKVETVR